MPSGSGRYLSYLPVSSLLVVCLLHVGYPVNIPVPDAPFPLVALFTFSGHTHNPRVHLNVPAVVQPPPLTGRLYYSHLLQAFGGMSDFTLQEGNVLGGRICLARKVPGAPSKSVPIFYMDMLYEDLFGSHPENGTASEA